MLYIQCCLFRFWNKVLYGTPNKSEVTSISVDNQKFLLSIRITLLIKWKYKMLSQICKVVTLTTNSLNLDI